MRTGRSWRLGPLLLGLGGCAATGPASTEPAAIARIPFTLTPADNLSIRATLNGTDTVELMFHTAVDSISLTKTATARLASFSANGTATVRSWGGASEARHSTGNWLQIGDLVWRDLPITEDENSGPGTDGKFGPNLFAGKVVEIDFAARELKLHATLPAIAETFDRLDLICRDGLMSIAGELTAGERRYQTDFLLHTGFGGTVLLDEQFVWQHELAASLPSRGERVLVDSYGKPVRTRKVMLPALRFGATTFADVSAELFHGTLGSLRTSIVGCGLLKQFHLIFDVEHRHLYVRRLASGARDGEMRRGASSGSA